MYEHKEADRIPITDRPWKSTVARWHREGMPEGMNFADYFDLDHTDILFTDNSPMYPVKIVEETDKYITKTTGWGATIRNWKYEESVPEFLDFTITTPDKWQEAKKRMTMCDARVNWDQLKKDWARLRGENGWIEQYFWFGFDVTHSWAVGTERLLMALVEEPQWCMDMFNANLDLDIQIAEAMIVRGFKPDCINWPDDLGFKQNQFMSVNMYRELLKPTMKRCVQWAHSHGIKTRLHSCGCITPFIPDFVAIGIDCLNPLEVKAGVDPVAVKKQFGDKLVLHGGINAVLWTDVDAIEAEMARVVPLLKQGGGYIWSSDHSVPSSVSLEAFRRITDLAKKLGTYE
jgi:uroporphyrinogen decarboxylase